MTIRGFGGGGDYDSSVAQDFENWRRWFRYGVIVAGVALIVGVIYGAARGGCSVPPQIPQDVRRDAICTALGRKPDCTLKPKSRLAATVYPTEVDYTVFVAGEFVGTWPIAGGTPVDPSLLTRDLVEYNVLLTMGTDELQNRLRTQHRCGRVAYVDRLLEWTLGEFSIEIVCAR